MHGLLLFLLLVTADLSPPEGSHLVGSPATLTLRWPGPPKARYFLELLNGSRVAWSGNVDGNSHELKDMAYGYYRWRVSELLPDGAFVPNQDFHTFLLVQDTQFDFNGFGGGPGEAGSPGQSVTLDLEPEGDFIRLVMKAGTRQEFLFVPGAAPLVVNARGGRGGPGGDGGPGGTITIHERDVESGKVVQVHVEGGAPGKGGEPGRDGVVRY